MSANTTEVTMSIKVSHFVGKIPFSWCPDPDDDLLDLYGLFTTPPPRVSRGKLKGRHDTLASIDTEMSSKSLGREAVEKAARYV